MVDAIFFASSKITDSKCQLVMVKKPGGLEPIRNSKILNENALRVSHDI